MGPKINGLNMAELVAKEVSRQLMLNMKKTEEQLTVAMSRIASLENEIALSLQNSNNNSLIHNSNPQSVSPRSNSSDVCRHWQRNRCTWTNCRFRHGSGASSTSSLSDFNTKDLEEVAPNAKPKVEKSVQVGFSSEMSLSSSSICAFPLSSSDLPSGPDYVSGVLQPEQVGAALSHNVVMAILEEVLSSAVTSAKPALAADVTKDKEWVENMLTTINKLEVKYGAAHKPIEEDGVIHSAQVAVPRINFQQVKPHLHRKLPKPESVPVQACSIDPTFYTSCTECVNTRSKGFQPERHPGCAPPFELSFPFGASPGFVTSLGVVAVPEEPIGGYVYEGGSGEATKWRLHAEAVYL